MRIAVSVDDERGLDSVVNPHFGRCPAFVMVDVADGVAVDVRSVRNPFYGHHEPGQVPGFIRSQGAAVMLTGGMGARAVGFFQQYGIQPVTGASGTVREALEQYLAGTLNGAEPCRESVEHGHGVEPSEGQFERDEAGRLEEEAEELQKQLHDVMVRLRRLQSR